jgi:hypothetical protein
VLFVAIQEVALGEGRSDVRRSGSGDHAERSSPCDGRRARAGPHRSAADHGGLRQWRRGRNPGLAAWERSCSSLVLIPCNAAREGSALWIPGVDRLRKLLREPDTGGRCRARRQTSSDRRLGPWRRLGGSRPPWTRGRDRPRPQNPGGPGRRPHTCRAKVAVGILPIGLDLRLRGPGQDGCQGGAAGQGRRQKMHDQCRQKKA